MAAVAHLALLLFAFINNIHSEEPIRILEKGDLYTFTLNYEVQVNSSCLISRYVGEEKLVLWNTSDSSSENSTLPDGLKQRMTDYIVRKKSYYRIFNLIPSDSGLYQRECWTDGKVTYERNTSIIICSRRGERKRFPVGGRDTVDLRCEDTADDLEIWWLTLSLGYHNVDRREDLWTRVFRDGTTSMTDIVKGGFQVVKKATGPRQSNITTAVTGDFTCLVMNQQQCVSSHPVGIYPPEETIYRSVGGTALLQCNGQRDDKPRWEKLASLKRVVFQNESLVFSSLALSDSGAYSCRSYYSSYYFNLVVCPTFGPPDVELFSGGENVTIRCIADLSRGGREFNWFMKSKQTQGKVVHLNKFDKNRIITSRESVTILNVSLEDTGEYWCAVIDFDSDAQCQPTAKTLLMYREPFGVYSTFYTVRCIVLSILLGVQCVIVLTVIYKTK